MSLEQVINDHAAAIRELAAAILGSAAQSANSTKQLAGAYAESVTAYAESVTAYAESVKPSPGKSAEKVLAEILKPEEAKPTDAKSAVAEAKAKAEAAKVQAEASKVAEEMEAAELNYAKDIQPKLIGYFKAHGKPKGMELLAKYNAKTGDGIKAADYPALLADIGG